MPIKPAFFGLIVVVSISFSPPVGAQIQAYEHSATMAGDDGQRDHYGISVGLTDSWAFAGADWDDEVGNAAGAAYVMERVLDGSWIINRKLLPDPESGYFGWSMAAAVATIWTSSASSAAAITTKSGKQAR